MPVPPRRSSPGDVETRRVRAARAKVLRAIGRARTRPLNVMPDIVDEGGARVDAHASPSSSWTPETGGEDRRTCTTCKHSYDAATAFQGARKTCMKCARRKALQARERRRDREERETAHSRAEGIASLPAPGQLDELHVRLRWIEDDADE